mgnify:CR=1 FL=1|tara:strand:+ start:438 stop:635 length:198 start_codon:yes stop_codon:yes gene_type:complete
MKPMSVTLDVLKLSGLLNFFVPCRVEMAYTKRCERCGAGVVRGLEAGAGGMKHGARVQAERTENI